MTGFWEEVIRPTLKEIRKLAKWKRPFGYLLLVTFALYLFVPYIVVSVLDAIHGE